MRIALLLALLFAAVSARGESSIVWKNGDELGGRIVSATAGAVTWESSLFEKPIELRRDVIREIVSRQELETSGEPHLLELNDGTRLFGTVRVSGSFVLFDSPRTETWRIPRDRVHAVRTVRDERLVWAGPRGALDWSISGGAELQENAAWSDESGGGALTSLRIGQPARLGLELPERFEVRVTLAAPTVPEFVLRIMDEGLEWRLETWGKSVVLVYGENRFIKAASLEESDRAVGLRLLWDGKTGEGKVGRLGEDELVSFSRPPREDPASDEEVTPETELEEDSPQSEVRLSSRCPELSLRRLEVWRWDGGRSAPPGDLVVPDAPPLEPGASEGSGEQIAWTELLDTGRLRGRLLASDGEWSTFEVGFLSDPVRVRNDGIRRLVIGGGEDSAEAAAGSRIARGSESIRGEWVPSDGPDWLWKPIGTEVASRVRLEADSPVEIRRQGAEEEFPEPVTLAYLESGEILPADLRSLRLDGESLRLRSTLYERGEFEEESLRALVLRSSPLDGRPGSPQWRSIGDVDVEIEENSARIPPMAAWGHPMLLWGERVRFEIPNRTEERFAGLRIRLFADGIDRTSRTTIVSIRTSGSRCYLSWERAPGETVQTRSVSVSQDEFIPVSLDWDDAELRVSVDGDVFPIPVGDVAPRSGSGLIFEPGYNPGGDSDALIRGLEVENRAGLSAVPYVENRARERLLFLPRFRREENPRHVLLAENGDALRGTIEEFDGEVFTVLSGDVRSTIPVGRVSGIVRYQDDASETAEPAAEAESETEPGSDPDCWIGLHNGARIGLEDPVFESRMIRGSSPLLGACRIPVGWVRLIASARPDPVPASDYLSGFRLRSAPEPNLLSESERSRQGEVAPDFELPDLEGDTIRLSDQREQVVVLVFWTTWSAPSVDRLGEAINLVGRVRGGQVSLIAVNEGESPSVIRPFLERRGWENLAVVMDSDLAVGRQFEVRNYPTSIVIRPGGIIESDLGQGEIPVSVLQRAWEAGQAEPSGD